MALPKFVTAAVLALGLGAAAISAVPAQAASPSFSFQFGVGPGMFGTGPGNGIILHFGDDNYFDYCLTNGQIRAQLHNYGYSNVKIVKEYNSTNKVVAVGYKNGSWYQLRVDRCTGKVDKIIKIKKKSDSSFQLYLNF